MITTLERVLRVGKYLVTPLARPTDNGHFAAVVSIRSGRGSTTHDRVFRFIPRFTTREGALQYALAEGQSWLQQHRMA